jgi:hypothetical protein
MRRRDFIPAFGGAAWPMAARAQQSAVPITVIDHRQLGMRRGLLCPALFALQR